VSASPDPCILAITARRRRRSGRFLSGGSDRAHRAERRDQLVAVAITRSHGTQTIKAIAAAGYPSSSAREIRRLRPSGLLRSTRSRW
jgi:hypothetical protein